MAKQRIEKPIKINGEFPVDLWSISIDLISFNSIGPVIVMKKGTQMRGADYMLYTVRTKKEMVKNGYSVYRMPEKLIIVALSRNECLNGLYIEGDKLIEHLENSIKKFKAVTLGKT